MKNLLRLAIISALLALIGALMVVPATAQEDDEGEGGIIVNATFGTGPSNFSTIYCTDTSCRDVLRFMEVGLLGVDVDTATIQAGVPGALAASYELQDDGVTYVLTLRDDMTWSDGTPITIDDVLYHWDVLSNADESAHPDAFLTADIASVEAIDENTLAVTMAQPDCEALGTVAGLVPVPSHVLSQYEYSELADLEFNLAPDVTSGAFLFGDYRTNEFTVIRGWDDYVDAELGYVNPTGIIQRVLSDQVVMLEDFLSPNGQVNVMLNPAPDRKDDIVAAAEGGDYQVYEFPGNTWDYMAFNLADPNDPQPAVDEDGNRVDQGYHPIFTDKTVRQAIAHAVDVDAIIQGAVFGYATPMAAHITPSSWAVNPDLAPRAYDVDLALSLLAEAGWVPQNPDAAPSLPDNPLVCDGCLYATDVDEAYNGTPMEFELLTNAGNTRREAIAVVIQDELAQIGITVNTNFIDFNALLDIMDAQSYDTFILGWRAGYPDSPDTRQLFSPSADTPGAGFNFTSFYNEEFQALEIAAITPSETNGCDQDTRAEIYYQMQEIMQDEMPYMWLYVQDGMYAWRSGVAGVDPRPAAIYWNIDTWAVAGE